MKRRVVIGIFIESREWWKPDMIPIYEERLGVSNRNPLKVGLDGANPLNIGQYRIFILY
jgi:uncharacterized membrane protein YczE